MAGTLNVSCLVTIYADLNSENRISDQSEILFLRKDISIMKKHLLFQVQDLIRKKLLVHSL